MDNYEQKLARTIATAKANYDRLRSTKRRTKFIDYEPPVKTQTVAKQCKGVKLNGSQCTRVASSKCGKYCKKHFTSFQIDV